MEQAKVIIAETGWVITTLAIIFGTVITLLIYVWNLTQRANDKRHESSEKLVAELVESKHTNDLILSELKLISKGHDEDIKELKAKWQSPK